MKRSVPGLAACLLVLSACASGTALEQAQEQVARAASGPPNPAAFGYCHGHGCSSIVPTGLTGEEWSEISGRFQPGAGSPVEERALIAAAVGRFEGFVGARVGTAKDLGGTFPGYGRNGQLDCVDEATNTTVFLRILESQRLLRWHDVGAPVTRASFSFDWPHSTATVTERASGRAYGIDSWFYDNGQDAVAVPLDQWLAGWSPE